MIRFRRIYAYFSQEDIDYLKKKGIVVEGGKGFSCFHIYENELYRELKQYFLHKKQKDYSDSVIGVKFSEEELAQADHYAFSTSSKGYPQPEDVKKFRAFTYVDYYPTSGILKVGQPNPFIIKGEPKWRKKETGFGLEWVNDCIFVRKELFEAELAPMGFTSRPVWIDRKGTLSQTAVQLIIPICDSEMMLENSVFDNEDVFICPDSGIKMYCPGILDFLPPFKTAVKQDLCCTQEYFSSGGRKLIISKNTFRRFVDLGILHKDTYLQPVRNSGHV